VWPRFGPSCPSWLTGSRSGLSVWTTALIDEEQFRSRNEALLQKKKDLQEKREAAEATAANREAVEVGLAEVKSLLADFDRVWEQMAIEEQREMMMSLIEELKVGKDGEN